MKKTLPIIVVLITLSLLGLIVLQASWLNNLLVLRRGQLNNKINEAGVAVAVDLFKGMGTAPSFKLQRKMSFGRFSNDISMLLKPPTIEEKYKLEDVQKKLQAAFNKEELHHINFEFAIINSSEDFEMRTPNFEKAYWDTISNKRLFVGIGPETAADLDGISSPEHLIIIVPDFTKQVWGSLRWIIVGAAGFMLIIIAAFFVTLRTLLNQKKLSEIKSDFINNMTHEFKTPLATISLAVDAIKNEKVQNDKEKLAYFTGIIKEENKRMNLHVETILQAALQEKQELQLKITDVHANEVIKQTLDNYVLQLAEKKGTVEYHLNAKTDLIMADRLHFSNLFSNLIDNAIKYGNENLHIKITTHSTPRYFIINVQDNGIGMAKESLKRIFEKFYRAHTGNVHNVKGFGLGMSYVKMVIDAHKGNIKVDSTLGKGTTFTVEMPRVQPV
ncbi:sensor histidine kinase [Parasediminibacterium sp. JCM 36343]|uniref:sensor histidine kinase n=1 Tax=Parasediminibacterium sp. JCM 36343 TaxID=3374279 RepID=UPI0039794134